MEPLQIYAYQSLSQRLPELLHPIRSSMTSDTISHLTYTCICVCMALEFIFSDVFSTIPNDMQSQQNAQSATKTNLLLLFKGSVSLFITLC